MLGNLVSHRRCHGIVYVRSRDRQRMKAAAAASTTSTSSSSAAAASAASQRATSASQPLGPALVAFVSICCDEMQAQVKKLVAPKPASTGPEHNY
uniref:Uncharacterized protein n=1 Tax=Gasterosteus aculeatus TaxID=69293 RepID=G3NCB6_GASAC